MRLSISATVSPACTCICAGDLSKRNGSRSGPHIGQGRGIRYMGRNQYEFAGYLYGANDKRAVRT